MKTLKFISSLMIIALLFVSCDTDKIDHPEPVNQTEVISDVTLSFTDEDGQSATYTYTDPKYQSNDYEDPVIHLEVGKTYTVKTEFFNKSNPDDIENVTEEVTEEKNDHFLEFRFFDADVTLSRIDGEETTDDNGIQIGLFTKWKPENTT